MVKIVTALIVFLES